MPRLMQAAVALPYSVETRKHPPGIFEVRGSFIVQALGFHVELYERRAVRTRRNPEPLQRIALVDTGVWRIGGYVRWRDELAFKDFFLLDEVDEVLRSHFPEQAGTAQRADLPRSAPVVRLTPAR